MEEEELWEDKDATVPVAAVVLPLSLTDVDAGFSDSVEIKRLIRGRTDWESGLSETKAMKNRN